jgi:hypothetical protein
MNRHASDTVSLIFGIAFLAVAAAWLLTRWMEVQLPSVGWVVACGLVLLGVLGLISSALLRRGDTPGQ